MMCNTIIKAMSVVNKSEAMNGITTYAIITTAEFKITEGDTYTRSGVLYFEKSDNKEACSNEYVLAMNTDNAWFINTLLKCGSIKGISGLNEELLYLNGEAKNAIKKYEASDYKPYSIDEIVVGPTMKTDVNPDAVSRCIFLSLHKNESYPLAGVGFMAFSNYKSVYHIYIQDKAIYQLKSYFSDDRISFDDLLKMLIDDIEVKLQYEDNKK